MHHSRLITFAAAAMTIALAHGAAAQGRGGARYDRATVQTVHGTIAAVDTLPSPRGLGGGLHVKLKADDKSYDVHLGPQSFLAARSLKLAVGDNVQVTGSVMKYNNASALLAASVTKGTVTVALRDSLGLPLWAAMRRGRPPTR